MLIVEIENCGGAHYRYAVKVNRSTIATGEVEHDQSKHWTLLLNKIAKHGRDQLFTDIMGMTPEEFKKQPAEKVDDLRV